MVALVVLDEEDKQVIIERLHSNPLFNCGTPLERLLVHPSVHTSVPHVCPQAVGDRQGDRHGVRLERRIAKIPQRTQCILDS